ncbi:MAG: hypothetical protein ACRENB_10245, partial [Gemmatimonadales bacterium]
MTYLFKLSSRIARLKRFGASLILVAACSKGERADFISPDPTRIVPTLATVRVEPRVATVKAGDAIQFSAVGLSSSGQELPVTVDWSASSGTISAEGRYVPSRSGRFTVTARIHGQVSISDSAQVGAWSSPTDVLQIVIWPDTTVVQPGESLHFAAMVGLANGETTTEEPLIWAATGGNVSSYGSYAAPGVEGAFSVSATASNGVKAESRVVVRRVDRRLLSLSVAPAAATLQGGDSRQFAATGTWNDGSSSDVNVTWSATGGSVSGQGSYTAGLTPGTYQVIGREKNGTLADTAVVVITAPTVTGIDLTPATVTLAPGASQQFSGMARMSDGTSRTVALVWAATGGTMGGPGLYTAGQTEGVFRVIASSGGFADTAAVTIVRPTTSLSQIVVNPSAASVPAGSSRQFSATGLWSDGSSGTPIVTWTSTGGTITSSGLYTAGSSRGPFRVIAVEASGRADTSTVTVTDPMLQAISLTPGTTSLQAAQTVQFSVSTSWSDGTSSSTGVTYSAQGGTITS